MPLKSITIGNFKGIDDTQTFRLAPLTLFIGPNSSGKSSCIHGIACLAQTLKVPTSSRPLVLDDEYAQVHLGRFIEVIHTKKYKDVITLGVSTESDKEPPPEVAFGLSPGVAVSVEYSFKSTLRTQDISLELLKIEINERSIRAVNRKNSYQMTDSAHASSMLGRRVEPLFIYPEPSNSLSTQADVNSTLSASVAAQSVVARQLKSTLYLGPFRQPPQRPYPTRGATPNEVGSMGEYSVPMLANEFLQSGKRPHLDQIGSWLNTIGLAKKLELSRVGKSDQFYANVELKDGVKLPLADLGYGVSQVLPVLVQCSFAPAGSTLLFEQPELHLHQGAAQMLAKVLIDTIKEKGCTIVAETHSRELFAQISKEIKAGAISIDDVVAYEVERKQGKSEFTPIKLEQLENGEVFFEHPWGKALETV